MSKIVLYEPSMGSDNLGDQIIVDGVKTALNNIVSKSFLLLSCLRTPLQIGDI